MGKLHNRSQKTRILYIYVHTRINLGIGIFFNSIFIKRCQFNVTYVIENHIFSYNKMLLCLMNVMRVFQKDAIQQDIKMPFRYLNLYLIELTQMHAINSCIAKNG